MAGIYIDCDLIELGGTVTSGWIVPVSPQRSPRGKAALAHGCTTLNELEYVLDQLQLDLTAIRERARRSFGQST